MTTESPPEPNLEGFELQDDVELFDVGMFEEGQGGFHIKNNPKDPYQRSQVIQRTGHGVDIRCTMIDAIHGAMSADSDYWSTLLVFKFRFDPQKRARRISRATIELIFGATAIENEIPEVEAISFDGHYSFLPSKQSETFTTGAEGGVGASFGAQANTSIKYEKTVARETSHATTISGAMEVLDNVEPNRVAKWTLLENQSLKTGVPSSIQVAVRVKRKDDEVFTCFPSLKCTADKWTEMRDFFGKVPVDDPVLLKPQTKATNKLRVYDAEELGSIDLQELSDVTFTKMIMDTVK
ncbi:intracellular serine protease [Fusarium heterosporum]|uniref:Intracellular serine protease n=1 Tax=Fusarium heterosporum TaxID=42747 RepID=A0A8H5TT79_FUSHE|nr:intracellular serine protease [Fusarium heterosporum]